MKKCEYCAKEISYHEIYCCKECEEKSQKYYDIRVKLQKLMSILNIAGTLLIAFGIFATPLHDFAGPLIMAGGGLTVGILTLILPTPPVNFTEKYKIKKSVNIVRIFGIILIVFGLACLGAGLFKIFA